MALFVRAERTLPSESIALWSSLRESPPQPDCNVLRAGCWPTSPGLAAVLADRARGAALLRLGMDHPQPIATDR
jgi:hypothetical protein